MLCEKRNSYHDSTSAEATIELLCDNILLEIFDYLNAREIKRASLVCKRWNEVIGLSAVIMKKFKFEITNKMLQLHVKHFGSSRNHQNYVIRVEDSTDWTLLGCTQFNRVKSLDILRSRYCDLISHDVIKVLSMMTELEKLNLIGLRMDVMEDPTQLTKMSKLKSITICGDNFTILDYLDAKELQDLQCMCNSNLKDFKPIANSLTRFSNLKRLTLKGCMEMLEDIDVNKTEFKLNFFEVYHINANPENVNDFAENLKNFLLQQADSLLELRFDFSMYETADGQRVVNDFLQIAFNKCKNLSFLDIRNLSISRNGDSYQNLSPNRSIKTLKVHWNFEGEAIKGLLRNCPKLQTLFAEYCYLKSDEINNIASLCKELIYLHTFKLIAIVKDDIVFENLKFLDISKIENSFEPLISLVTKCLVIQQIRIHECNIVESFPMELIIQQPSMRKLIVQDNCYEIFTDSNKQRVFKESNIKQN